MKKSAVRRGLEVALSGFLFRSASTRECHNFFGGSIGLEVT